MDRSEEVASIINSMLPELTLHVQEQQRAIAKQSLEKRLAVERVRIKQRFDHKIEEEARSINEELATKVILKKQQVFEARERYERARQGQPEITISENDKQHFIDETIREITSSGVLTEIREGMMKKVWAQLEKQYQKKMGDELDCIRRDLQAAYNERKKAKKQYYTENIQRSIKQKIEKLENEYSSLQSQRDSIKTKLQDCRAARDAARTSCEQIAERYTQQISSLRDSINASRSQ